MFLVNFIELEPFQVDSFLHGFLSSVLLALIQQSVCLLERKGGKSLMRMENGIQSCLRVWDQKWEG